jgi:hypothetical protein
MLNHPDYIEITKQNVQIITDLVERKDWTTEERSYLFRNYLYILCQDIKDSPSWEKSGIPRISIVLRYSKYPFVINEDLFRKFARYVERAFNSCVNTVGYTSSNISTGLIRKKKYIENYGHLGFYLTARVQNKIERLIQSYLQDHGPAHRIVKNW